MMQLRQQLSCSSVVTGLMTALAATFMVCTFVGCVFVGLSRWKPLKASMKS